MQKLDTLQKYLVVSLVTRYFFGVPSGARVFMW